VASGPHDDPLAEGASARPATVQNPPTTEFAPVRAETPSDGSMNGDWTAFPKPSPAERGKDKRGVLAGLRELPVLLVVAFVLALLIKTFLVQAFYIPSESMTNTLKVGDRVLVNKLVYHFHPPRRGDIIVFEDPHPAVTPHRNSLSAAWHWLTEGLGVSNNPEKDFIKRVIGLPGDTITMRKGVVRINGVPLKEPYLNPLRDLRDFGPQKVPADTLFVMGDNRANSNDSRFLLGPIPMDKVVGKAFVVIWPPSRVGWLHGL
jgi:signal peptidase I